MTLIEQIHTKYGHLGEVIFMVLVAISATILIYTIIVLIFFFPYVMLAFPLLAALMILSVKYWDCLC